jgi:hypothetical protein
MAYQGRKVFQAGEVLSSSDMNSTVDQTVMVFADATARNTAIPSPTEGMLVYLKDTNDVLKYDGSSWIAVIDFETVDELITTEGDLVIGGSGGAAERLPIGAANSVLSSDGTNISWVVSEDGVASNNFVIDMNNTTNNTAAIGETKPAGPYSMTFSSGDTSFDVYLIASDGTSVGYSNNTSITASADFDTVVIFGVANDEVITFSFSGVVANADGVGDEPGAGAYLESITPTDLPALDDTATVTGGNFGANTEITFESGATVLSAKNIVVTNSTEIVVTRPDALISDDAPYTVRAKTTGVPEPTGTNANILTDAVTAGSNPTWVTTSILTPANINTAYSETLEATDADGAVTYSVTTGSLPIGLSLDSATGVISGTPTDIGAVFTVTAEDEGGQTVSREFTLGVLKATGGTISFDGARPIHTFSASGTFEPLVAINDVGVLVVGGGGGGAAFYASGVNIRGAGGGGGGVRSTFQQDSYSTSSINLPQQNVTVTVGAGGSNGSNRTNGNTSSFGSLLSSIGGGRGSFGQDQPRDGSDGAAGGGGGFNGIGGTGSNGGDGSNGNPDQFGQQGCGGGGGPLGQDGILGQGGDGTSSLITGTEVFYAGGGFGGFGSVGAGDVGRGGNGGNSSGDAGTPGNDGQVVITY